VELLGESDVTTKAKKKALRTAESDSTVLIVGENLNLEKLIDKDISLTITPYPASRTT